MKQTLTQQLKRGAAIALFLCAGTLQVYSQSKKDKDNMVKVRITKIIDGEKTVIEKMVPESELNSLGDIAKDAKGKNVQVYVSTVDDDKKGKKEDKKQEKHCYTYNYSYNGNGTSSSNGKCNKIIIEKDGEKESMIDINLDSLMKNMKLSFDFNFDSLTKNAMANFNFDSDALGTFGDIVIINDGKETHISASGGDKVVKKIEKRDGNAGEEGKNETTVIVSSNGKDKKKVVIKTIVKVEDVKEENTTTGVKKEEMKTENFSFFPNPTIDGKFNLEFESEGKEPANVTITDINGKEVYKETFKGEGKQKKEIDLGSNKGTFILNLQQGKKSISRKIIVE